MTPETPVERMATDLGLDVVPCESPHRFRLASNAHSILLVETNGDGQIRSVSATALVSRVLPDVTWNKEPSEKTQIPG